MNMRNAPRGLHASVCHRLRQVMPGIAVTPSFGKFHFYGPKYSAEVILNLPDDVVPTSVTPEDVNAVAAWLLERVAPALLALSKED